MQNLTYFNKPPESWTIHGYYQFRKLQSDFSSIFRKENSWLNDNLRTIEKNLENKFSYQQIKQAKKLLRALKVSALASQLGRTPFGCSVDDPLARCDGTTTRWAPSSCLTDDPLARRGRVQMSDPNVSTFWKEINHVRELNNVRAEGMLKAARATTDGVLNSTQLDSSSEYIPTDESDESDAILTERKKSKKGKSNESLSSSLCQLCTQSITTDNKNNNMNESIYTEIRESGSNIYVNQQQSSQHEVDPLSVSDNSEMNSSSVSANSEMNPLSVSTNNEMNPPETCKEDGENDMELDLQEPSVVHIVENNLEGLDWNVVMQKVETYRNHLKKTRYAFDPTLNLLSDVFSQMSSALPKTRFCIPQLTKEEAKFIDKLLNAEDIDDIPTVTEEEKALRKLFSRILDSITMFRKNDLPEVEHTFRNIVPLLDATIGKDSHFWLK
ncbi:11142_t:CDS:10, partial [Scutellospora calospora]